MPRFRIWSFSFLASCITLPTTAITHSNHLSEQNHFPQDSVNFLNGGIHKKVCPRKIWSKCGQKKAADRLIVEITQANYGTSTCTKSPDMFTCATQSGIRRQELRVVSARSTTPRPAIWRCLGGHLRVGTRRSQNKKKAVLYLSGCSLFDAYLGVANPRPNDREIPSCRQFPIAYYTTVDWFHCMERQDLGFAGGGETGRCNQLDPPFI